MPFIPHTDKDIQEMLTTIGETSVDALFDEIPQDLLVQDLKNVPSGITELELARLMRARAKMDSDNLCFIGAGAYEHHIPAAVWDIAARGEFYTAYTPYQAEASQGTLQLLYEYQTMMANLTGMDVSNASLYDGATALAEAVLMAVRCQRKIKTKRILMPATCHPHYRQVVQSIVAQQHIELVELPFADETGTLSMAVLNEYSQEPFTALVIPQPNFFGAFEEVDSLTNWAHAQGALVIAVTNPTALALLKAPGEWGDNGADIVVGEGQPLGIPLASGGPYFGFMTCKKALVRQMPGRIVGRTEDLEGKSGFSLTLQAREQHIRRSKATSNICTNQGLAVTAATIFMSIMGNSGLSRVAQKCHQNTILLRDKLTAIQGVELVFRQPVFHEMVIRLNKPVDVVLNALNAHKIQGGLNLKPYYPQLGECLLVCATETKTQEDIERYAQKLTDIMQTNTDTLNSKMKKTVQQPVVAQQGE